MESSDSWASSFWKTSNRLNVNYILIGTSVKTGKPLAFIPVDMLELRSNQLEKNNEKETIFWRTDYTITQRRETLDLITLTLHH